MTQAVVTAPRTLNVALLGLHVRAERRSVIVVSVVVTLTACLVLVQLITGDYPMSVPEVLKTLNGHGTRSDEFAIYTLRLPRALTAVFTGAAFGASGAVYQSITRNPLGSPDIIGFTNGAAFGAVMAIAVFGATDTTITISALSAGLGVAALVYLLAFKGRGGVQGFRLILVGIGISAVLASFTSYFLSKANIIDAQEAFTWLTGSLNDRDWTDVRISLAGLVLLGPVLIGLGPGLRMSEMGDDAARALGAPVSRNRLYALAFGALACAVAVVCAGPITFVSLAAPQIARRMTGSPTVRVIPSMALGAILLIASDLLAQTIFPSSQMPVGVTTLALGGAYLAWLIAREGRNKIG